MSDNWNLIYEHREDGARISGSLDLLVRAIRRGGVDVQIRYHFSDASVGRRGVWIRNCSSVTFAEDFSEEGRPPIVSAMVTDIPDTQLDPERGGLWRMFSREPFAFEWQAFNTNGLRHRVEFDHKTREVVDEDLDRLQIAWYVRGARGGTDLEDIVSDTLISDIVSETLMALEIKIPAPKVPAQSEESETTTHREPSE